MILVGPIEAHGGQPFVPGNQDFFQGKPIVSGQDRIFDPFSGVSGPGRCPKRSGTSFSSSLHY